MSKKQHESSANRKRRKTGPELKVNPKFASMFSRYDQDQMNALVNSIATNGQFHPIFINKKGEILDGHNRDEACKRLGIRPKYEIVKLATEEAEILFILECNLAKRDLNDFERIEKVVLYMEPIEIRKAEERKIGSLRRGDKTPLGQIDTNEPVGRVRSILAPKAHVGEITYYRGSWLVKHCPEDMKSLLRRNLFSIDRAYTILHRNNSLTTRPFSGELFRIEQSTVLIRGKVSDNTVVENETVDMIFPSADLDRKMTVDIALFAARALKKGGFLILYCKHDSVRPIVDIVNRKARSLKLVQVFSAPFEDWLNVDGNPIIGHTALFLIYWRPVKKKAELIEYTFEQFPVNVQFEDEDEKENRKYIITGPKASLFVFDYILESLQMKLGMTICDPTCGKGELGIRAIKSGLKFVGIENDLEIFQIAKQRLLDLAAESSRERLAISARGQKRYKNHHSPRAQFFG